MSVCESAICLDCLEAYSSGGSHIIGYPSLNRDPEPIASKYEEDSVGEKRNFGFLCEGLKSLKMCTYSLLEYAAFLDKHNGHRIYLHNDHSDLIAPELSDGFDCLTDFSGFKIDHVEAFYEIKCNTCNIKSRLEHNHPQKMIPFEKFVPSPAQIKEFTDKALLGDKYLIRAGDNYRFAFDLLPTDESIENVSVFLKNHSEHELEIRLSLPAENDCSKTFTIETLLEKVKKVIDDDLVKHYQKAINEGKKLNGYGNFLHSVATYFATEIEKRYIDAQGLPVDEIYKIYKENEAFNEIQRRKARIKKRDRIIVLLLFVLLIIFLIY